MDRLAKQHPQSTPVIRELNQLEVQQVSGGLVGEGNLSDFHQNLNAKKKVCMKEILGSNKLFIKFIK